MTREPENKTSTVRRTAPCFARAKGFLCDPAAQAAPLRQRATENNGKQQSAESAASSNFFAHFLKPFMYRDRAIAAQPQPFSMAPLFIYTEQWQRWQNTSPVCDFITKLVFTKQNVLHRTQQCPRRGSDPGCRRN